jgi:hypothetical protein
MAAAAISMVLWAAGMPAARGASSVASAAPGTTVNFSTDPTAGMTALTDTEQGGGSTLLFSDDPESLPGPGIAYQDTVGGVFRVFLYHQNGSGSALYLGVVVANPGTSAVTVTVQRAGLGGPATSGIAAGKQAVQSWFASSGSWSITLKPGASAWLYPALSQTQLPVGEVESAIVDAAASGPLRVSVVAQRKPSTSLAGLKVLPNTYTSPSGTPMRGTFQQSALSDTYSADASGAGQYAYHLADVGSYLQGYSAVDGVSTVDYGNYGVLYTTTFDVTPSSATTAGQFTLLMNPRGGSFATASLVQGIEEVLLPGDQVALSPIYEAAVIGQYPLASGTTTVASLQWMPAGGSSLPVDILVYPD